MKGKEKFLVFSVVLCLLFSTLSQIQLVHAQSQKGPRSPYLDIIFYTSPESCYNALKSGDIDIMAYPISKGMYEDATGDPDILLAPYTDSYDIRGFNFNPNDTINARTDHQSPLSNESFRKALAFLVDKEYIISEVFDYFADRIDAPFPESQRDWWNTSVTYPHYPYEYDWVTAAAILDAAGFVDRDSDDVRNYPLGWRGREDGPNLDPIIFCVEKERAWEVVMGGCLRDLMESLGIPVKWLELWSDEYFIRILIDRNYHICTGTQVVYKAPIWWYPLAIATFTIPFSGGQQFVYPGLGEYLPGIKMVLGYPLLIRKLRNAMYSPDWEESIQNIKNAQGIYIEHVFEVPVCSMRSYFAYRKRLAGIVNEKGFGLNNPYTFLNAYRTDDPNHPIRIGLITEPRYINILCSSQQPDYQCLDKIYTGLLNYNPYDPTVDQPWIAHDWEVGTWIDPDDGLDKTVVTYWFRKDAYWVKPVTGETDGFFTANDYEFTCHYIYAQDHYLEGMALGCPHRDRFKDIHHVEVVNDFTVKVYMNVSSMWAYSWPTYPLLPKHKWLREPLTYNKSDYFEASTIELPGTLPLNEYVVSGSEDTKIKVRLVNGSETWLEWGEHFMWKKGELYINTDSLNGVKIDKLWVYYWRNGDAMGYTPGNLPWEDILEGCGTHYVINIDPSSSFILNANRHFFMETPILGEIDWRWYWKGTSSPLSGHYKIDILDITKVTGAYCNRGDGMPDSVWFPGADIDPTDVGHVGLLDLVIVSNNYAKTFGEPP
jgi:ABC-type transport system substrate-binding protein